MIRRPYILIDDCTKEESYEILSSPIGDMQDLRDKELSLDELRKSHRIMLKRQLKDWKEGKEYFPGSYP